MITLPYIESVASLHKKSKQVLEHDDVIHPKAADDLQPAEPREPREPSNNVCGDRQVARLVLVLVLDD